MPKGQPGIPKSAEHRAKIAEALRGKAKSNRHRAALAAAARGGDTRPFEERFWNLVAKDSADGCWLWLGSLTHDGYGVLYELGSMLYAHRVAYSLTHGTPDATLDVCHNGDKECPRGAACRHRRCCNPAHLEAVTHRENCQRAYAP